MIAVVCMKWGAAFEADYVNILYRAVARHLSQPFRFYCFTDNPVGLADGIVARPLPELGFLPPKRFRMGCWPKIGLFQPGLIVEDCALFLDLDVFVTGSLDAFVDRQRTQGGLHILREWNSGLWNLLPLALRPDRGAQSSAFAWHPAEQHHVYETLRADPEAAFAGHKNDQQFIRAAGKGVRYWPHGWAASFKKSCVWLFPFNLVLPDRPRPASARIVVFHGAPRPHEVARSGRRRWGTSRRFGFGPIAWVRDYWLGEGDPQAPKRRTASPARSSLLKAPVSVVLLVAIML